MTGLDDFGQTLVGSLEVDDLPDVGQVVGLPVLVLEVEGVLPHVDPDEGSEREQRVLVGGRGDGELLRHRVNALEDRSGMQLRGQQHKRSWK